MSIRVDYKNLLWDSRLPRNQAFKKIGDAGAKDPSEFFQVEVSGDIETVLDDWQWLETKGLSTPFQTRAWLLPFYKILAPRSGVTPVFVILRDLSTGHPAMLLTLCARHQHAMTIIEFADLGVSDYNAPLLAKSFNPSPAKWREIWNSITAAFKEVSILRLDKMPHMIGDRPNPLAQYGEWSKLMDIASWGFTLPATAAEYRDRVLNPSFTRELAKKARRVAKRGNAEYVLAETREDKHKSFDILAEQRQARCDEMGRSNILANPIYRRFYEAVAVESPANLTNITAFKVDDNIVGTILALNHNGATHVIMSTYMGGDWKSCSLGNVVMQSAVEYAIDKGITFFDLTIGNEGYKQDFGAVPHALYSALQPLTPAGKSFTILMTCYARLKKALKQSLRSAQPEINRGQN